MNVVKDFEDRLEELNRIRGDFLEKSRIDPIWEGYLLAVSNEVGWVSKILAKLNEPKIDFASLERDD